MSIVLNHRAEKRPKLSLSVETNFERIEGEIERDIDRWIENWTGFMADLATRLPPDFLLIADRVKCDNRILRRLQGLAGAVLFRVSEQFDRLPEQIAVELADDHRSRSDGLTVFGAAQQRQGRLAGSCTTPRIGNSTSA